MDKSLKEELYTIGMEKMENSTLANCAALAAASLIDRAEKGLAPDTDEFSIPLMNTLENVFEDQLVKEWRKIRTFEAYLEWLENLCWNLLELITDGYLDLVPMAIEDVYTATGSFKKIRIYKRIERTSRADFEPLQKNLEKLQESPLPLVKASATMLLYVIAKYLNEGFTEKPVELYQLAAFDSRYLKSLAKVKTEAQYHTWLLNTGKRIEARLQQNSISVAMAA